MVSIIRIGTRGSPLALRQAHELRARLMAAHGLAESAFHLEIIKTTGDRILDRPLAAAGGKELFTREIEEALADRRIDMAVHSAKDMPTVLPGGLVIAAYLPREDVRDAFISLKAASLAELPPGAMVGTASLRRAAQCLNRRPDLKVAMLRGNVETRLRKLADGEADATFLAMAGLRRLGLEDRATSIVATEDMLPAVAQGAICVETRADAKDTRALLAAIHDIDTADCVDMERAFLAALDGSCRTPIGGLAQIEGELITFRGEVLTPDGTRRETITASGPRGEAERLGGEAGAALKARVGPGFFQGDAGRSAPQGDLKSDHL